MGTQTPVEPYLDQIDFRNFLQRTLVQRCKTNPSYSLRAYARALCVDPSYISKLLNGKRDISPKVVQRLAPKLGLSPEQIRKISNSKKDLKKSEQLVVASALQANYTQLTEDIFQLISDWYHYAILELVTIEKFKSEPKWISTMLGIKVAEVNDALQRLFRLGMLKKSERGSYIVVPKNHSTIGNQYTTTALKKMQEQVLSMAIGALQETPIEERDQSAMTMAIDSDLLPEAKQKIKKFRRELCDFLQTGRKTDRVYHLSLSLYPVSKKIKVKV